LVPIPGAEDEKASTANAVLKHFPENTNEWTVELVTRVRAGQSYTLFYNPITIKFDSPTGTARLLIQGNEIARTEADSSPSNQDALTRFCDTLFDNMASSFEPGSEARRKIGFSQD